MSNKLKELIEKVGQETADDYAKSFFRDLDAFVSESHLFDGTEAITDVDTYNRFIDWIKKNDQN